MHYKRMYDEKEHLYAFDLDGRDVNVTIDKVFAGELVGDKGRKTRKPMLQFVGAKKKLALNKTNGRTIATMYGPDTTQWVGKSITLYPTVTEYNNEQRECIRVRPTAPTKGKAKGDTGMPAPIAAPPDEDELNEMAARDREGS